MSSSSSSSLDLHASHQGKFLGGTIAVTILAAVFVVLRFLARWKKGLKIGVDDYTLVVGLVCAVF